LPLDALPVWSGRSGTGRHNSVDLFQWVSAQSTDDRVGLDLDEKPRVEQTTNHKHRAGWPDLPEELSVCTADLLPVAGRGYVDAGANDVLGPSVEFSERRDDDL
jgi:hypothetical protein